MLEWRLGGFHQRAAVRKNGGVDDWGVGGAIEVLGVGWVSCGG